jgi:8-oxo-dGTP pyrophosphatase MutT (NUDIX family)
MEEQIFDLDLVEAVLEPFDWGFARERSSDIEEVWAHEKAAKPRLFNGKVLIQHRGEARGRVFHAGYSETDYKPFLAWHRLGYPPPQVRNGFAMAALRSADGAFLLGEMAAHTANAGKIYFAAGTPDLDDVKDGRVDLEGSVLRELCEETGLRPDEVRIGQGWTAVLMAVRVAFMRPCFIDLPAVEARTLMLERIAQSHEDELADIHIVRGLGDIDDARMPQFQQAYLRHVFG